MMHQIRNIFNSTVDIVLLGTDGVPKRQRARAEESYGAKFQLVSAPPPPPGGLPYYSEVMTKLLVFKLYDQYDRVIIMDSDAMLLQSIDHLFDLPDFFDVAAPRFTWGDNLEITSTMLVINLSEKLWKRVEKRLGRLEGGEYDMDLINREFKQQMLILPGTYCTLNSFWETNSIPNFLTISSEKNDTERLKDFYHHQAIALHFTALGKPWTFDEARAKELRPDAHPIFWEQFGKWHELKKEACPPAGSKASKPGLESLHRTSGGKGQFVETKMKDEGLP
ncbi:hypothetical protein HDV00_009959 [Rhizophlyctis rosea]|nr:hypothetical protein HDV00_009959 [Rhizophlyctis rosea]